MSGFAWTLLYHISRRHRMFDYAEALLVEMSKVIHRTKIGRVPDNLEMRTFTPALSHCAKIGRAHV